MSFSDLERRLTALERRLPQGMMVSTTFGRAEVRPFQVGFPAILTSTFDPSTGYSWSQLVVDTTVPDIDSPPLPRTGNMAFTPDNNTTLQAGQPGWLEVDPQAGGWIFNPSYSFGSGCPVTENSPWVTVWPPTVLNGALYLQGAQIAPFVSADGSIQMCLTNLTEPQPFACDIECGSGSGSGCCDEEDWSALYVSNNSGLWPVTQLTNGGVGGSCPNGQSYSSWWGTSICVQVGDYFVTVTWQLCCTMYNSCDYAPGFYRIGGNFSIYSLDGKLLCTWQLFTCPVGNIESSQPGGAVDVTSCSPFSATFTTNGVWQTCCTLYSYCDTDCFDLLTALLESTVFGNGETSTWTISTNAGDWTANGPDCANAGAACPGGSGSGSGSGPSGGGSGGGSGSGGCPTSGTQPVTISGLTGTCAALNGSFDCEWDGTAFTVTATTSLGFVTVAFVCDNSSSGTVSMTGPAVGALDYTLIQIPVSGTVGPPVTMNGEVTLSSGSCNGQTISAVVA